MRRTLLIGFAEHLTTSGTPTDLSRALELWREAHALDAEDAAARTGLADVLNLSARRAALAGDRVRAGEFMSEAVALDPGYDGDRAAEAGRRLSMLLVEHAAGGCASTRSPSARRRWGRRARSTTPSGPRGAVRPVAGRGRGTRGGRKI